MEVYLCCSFVMVIIIIIYVVVVVVVVIAVDIFVRMSQTIKKIQCHEG